jgi:hypothetical protein
MLGSTAGEVYLHGWLFVDNLELVALAELLDWNIKATLRFGVVFYSPPHHSLDYHAAPQIYLVTNASIPRKRHKNHSFELVGGMRDSDRIGIRRRNT